MPYRDPAHQPPALSNIAMKEAFSALEDAARDDDIAFACLSMLRHGANESTVIAMAIRELLRSRRELQAHLKRLLESHAVPLVLQIDKDPTP